MNNSVLVGGEQAELADELDKGLTTLGLPLNRSQIENLLDFLVHLQRWNRVHNLTAVRDVASMVNYHLLDCLAVVPILSGPNLLDVGTGAGLPGIPIAIACPNLAVTLIDSNGKKTAFLQHATTELGLKNTVVVHARVEQWQGGQFDTIVSRAYSDLRKFVLGSMHLLKQDGILLAMKGTLPDQEIADLPAGFRVSAIQPLVIPGIESRRNLVVIEKI